MKKKSHKPISEEFVKRATIKWLSSKGWGTNLQFGGLRDKGADITVRHNNYPRYFILETKGDGNKSTQSKNENNFIVGLGQLVTRITTLKKGYYYGLALPEPSAKIAKRRIPFQLAKELHLYIFSVNENGKVEQYSNKDFKITQTEK